MTSTDPDWGNAIADFKRGGWVTALFGLAGGLVRLLITDEAHPAIWWVRRLLASCIVGVLSYFALWGTDIPGIYKSIILTTSGMACPEIVDIVIKRYRHESKKIVKRAKR